MKKTIRTLGVCLLVILCLITGKALGNESNLLKAFMKAYNTNIGMKGVIERNQKDVPAEIMKLLAGSHKKGISEREKLEKQFLAETMAREYKNVTGNISYLIKVKRDIFESKLHAPVRSVAVKGIHTITMPPSTPTEKNVFRPDNIIIHAGEWVRWVNDAGVSHIFASMPLLGKQIIFTPSIKPDEIWIQRFTEPGEYYYFCYIHNSMVGKITVLPAGKDAKGKDLTRMK